MTAKKECIDCPYLDDCTLLRAFAREQLDIVAQINKLEQSARAIRASLADPAEFVDPDAMNQLATYDAAIQRHREQLQWPAERLAVVGMLLQRVGVLEDIIEYPRSQGLCDGAVVDQFGDQSCRFEAQIKTMYEMEHGEHPPRLDIVPDTFRLGE